MAVYDEPTYYIILRRKKRGYELLYNIGDESKAATVLRLSGKNADKVFRDIVTTLAKHGAAIPMKVSDYEQVYSIREDLGPVVGAYLILVRRARNVKKWSSFFKELVDGHYVGVAKAFSSFLELAMELSRPLKKSKGYTLSPVVVDALSSALKQFVDRMSKAH